MTHARKLRALAREQYRHDNSEDITGDGYDLMDAAAHIDALAARLAEAETDAAYAQSLSLKLAAVENALFKIRNTAVDALNELIAVARGRECGACGRAIPPGGSTSCSLDHAALAPTDQPTPMLPMETCPECRVYSEGSRAHRQVPPCSRLTDSAGEKP